MVLPFQASSHALVQQLRMHAFQLFDMTDLSGSLMPVASDWFLQDCLDEYKDMSVTAAAFAQHVYHLGNFGF